MIFYFYEHSTDTKMSFRRTSNSIRSHGGDSILQMGFLESSCTGWLQIALGPFSKLTVIARSECSQT